MAKLTLIQNSTYVLILDADEAGYLRDLLVAHVSGKLVTSGEPLGRVREALEDVPRRLAKKSPEYGKNGYAVLERYMYTDDEDRALRRLAEELGSDHV